MGEGEGTRGSELHNILECKIFVFTRMVVVVMAVLAVSAGLESRKGEGWRERERERERGGEKEREREHMEKTHTSFILLIRATPGTSASCDIDQIQLLLC